MENIRQEIIKNLHKFGLYKIVHKIYYTFVYSFWRAYSKLTHRNEKFLKQYNAQHTVRKLHMGCGTNYLTGWVNTDLYPNAKRIKLNVTKKFPFADNSFDYAFTEHVIEHMPYMCGQNMLQECFRVLKPGGVLRVVTPDMKFLIALYQDEQKQIHQDYIKWNSDLFIRDAAPHNALSVFNNYVRDWGHVYIYDIPSLTKALESYGYINIKTPKLNESDHADLRGLEHDTRHPAGFLALESLVIEATKP